jgi:hypothetical protein
MYYVILEYTIAVLHVVSSHSSFSPRVDCGGVHGRTRVFNLNAPSYVGATLHKETIGAELCGWLHG